MSITKNLTRFLIISDTHDLDISSLLNSLPPVDVVLHCGDITECGELEGYRKAADALAALDAELKLVIPGNHDASLDAKFYESQEGELANFECARALWASYRQQNLHFLDEGTYSFSLSTGAVFKVYASPYTPKYGISAFQYPTSEDRYNDVSTENWTNSVATNDSRVPDSQDIDIMMTHGPPKYILDHTHDKTSGGCHHLRKAVERSRPLLHCFGHIHAAWGSQNIAWRSQLDEDEIEEIELEGGFQDEAIKLRPTFTKRTKAYAVAAPYDKLERGKRTLFVNAAMGNKDGKPENRPWLVELSLKK